MIGLSLCLWGIAPPELFVRDASGNTASSTEVLGADAGDLELADVGGVGDLNVAEGHLAIVEEPDDPGARRAEEDGVEDEAGALVDAGVGEDLEELRGVVPGRGVAALRDLVVDLVHLLQYKKCLYGEILLLALRGRMAEWLALSPRVATLGDLVVLPGSIAANQKHSSATKSNSRLQGRETQNRDCLHWVKFLSPSSPYPI